MSRIFSYDTGPLKSTIIGCAAYAVAHLGSGIILRRRIKRICSGLSKYFMWYNLGKEAVEYIDKEVRREEG